MTRPFSSLLTCAAAAALVCCMAAPAGAESLEKAVESALNNHPAVAAAFAGRDVAHEQRVESRSAYFPELNVNAATGRVYGDNSTSRGLTVDRGSGYSWSHEGGVSVRQMLFDGMETSNRVDAATLREESASVSVVDIRENLALRAAMAYLEVLRNRESVAMIRDHGKKIADYRERIRKMVDQGAADESMSVQAHDIQNQLDGTLADVEGQLNKAIAEYTEVVGHMSPDALVRPKSMQSFIPASVDEAIKIARDGHPAVIAARLQKDAVASETDAERGTLYPDFTGELSAYKKDIDDIIGGEVVDERALLRMNWTFSTGGAQRARVRESLHRQAEAQAKANELAGNLEREIRKAYAELGAAQERLKVGHDRIKVSGDLVNAYEKQFELAKVTLLNLLQVENTHFTSKLGVLNADYRQLAAQYAVLANTGQLQKALNVRPVLAANEQ